MGAWGSSARRFKSKEECTRFVRNFCETEEHEGKDIDFFDREFSTVEQAEQLANEKEDKWGNAVAVSYLGTPDDVRETATKKKLDQLQKVKFKELQQKLQTLIGEAGEARTKGEIEYCKCPECGSKINSHFLIGFRDHQLLEQIKEGKSLSVSYECPACRKDGIKPKLLKVQLKQIEKVMGAMSDMLGVIAKLRTKVEEENPKVKFWVCTVSINS